MAKSTKETEITIEKNLEYIGLNLNKLPKIIKEFEPLNFRPSKSYDDTIYKVYKYVNIKDIEILLTPLDRLSELRERYKLSSPICEYLDSKKEENIEKFANFMKMLSTIDKKRIEEISIEQESLNEKIPYEVKYPNNFIWQIYYSDYAKKYFMLVPINEQDNNALFYLIKEQISNTRTRKGRYIYTPISHLEYSGQYLTKSEISDLENYLWYFTKEWPNVYEVYDKDGNMCIKIIGETKVYDKIKSIYSISLDTKADSLEYYKLLKAMFILATGAKEQYNFNAKINSNGEIEFWDRNIKIEYSNLTEYIKLEYLDKIDKLKYEEKEQKELKRKLTKFKNIIEDLTQEYLLRQRQIATFLECKKTFFGRVKYFFKKKNNKKEKTIVIKKVDKEEVKKDEDLEELYKLKQQYTIEDLINICTKLEEVIKENTNYNLDISAMATKEEILSKKIDNADLYIKEIDKHKKSIFEFWKFTSKDEVQTLNQAEEIEEKTKTKMKKYFDFEADLQDFGKVIDELQRRKLSKNETDAIFAIKQVPESFRELNKEKETDIEVFIEKNEDQTNSKSKKVNALEKDLIKLKKEYSNEIEAIREKDFDIFGGLIEDYTKIKTINNQKHREIEKDKYKILNINLDTDIKIYIENLESYLTLIKEALNKIKSPYDMSLYSIASKKSIEGMNIFNINPREEINKEILGKKAKIILHKLDIKESTPVIFYSNIMFYDNLNKTLPLGMDLSSEVLVNLEKLDVKYIKEENFYINYRIDEFKYGTKQIQIYEYEVEE